VTCLPDSHARDEVDLHFAIFDATRLFMKRNVNVFWPPVLDLFDPIKSTLDCGHNMCGHQIVASSWNRTESRRDLSTVSDIALYSSSVEESARSFAGVIATDMWPAR